MSVLFAITNIILLCDKIHIMTASILRLHESLSVVLRYRERTGNESGLIGTWGMLRVGVEVTAFGISHSYLMVASSMPTAIVSTVWAISVSFAKSASPVSSSVGGEGV